MIELRGVPLWLSISDPWDLVTEIGSAPLLCEVRSRPEANLLVLRLDVPVTYKGQTCWYVTASPRHDHDAFDGLVSTGPVHVAGTAVSTEANALATPVRGVMLLGELSRRER